MVFILAFFFALIYRAILVYINRAWFRQGFFSDSSVHFTIISQLKKNPKSQKIDQYVIPNPMAYPLGFHRLASLLPLSLIQRYSYLPNLLIFSFFSGLYITYIHYVELELMQRDDMAIFAICLIVYFVSVSNLIFAGSAISYIKLSERLLGRMSCSFYFLTLSTFLIWGDDLSLYCSIVFGAFAILSSTFATQLILFTVLPLALVFLNPVVLLIFLGSIVLSLLLSRFYSYKCIRHMMRYWRIYKRFVKKNIMVLDSLSRFIKLDIFFSALKTGGFKGGINYLITREPSRTLIFYPEIFLLAFLLLVTGATVDSNMILPLVPILIVYLLTTTEKFNHLGESYRYIEYGLYFYLPLVIAVVGVDFIGITTFWGLLTAYCLVVVFLMLSSLYRDDDYPEDDKLATFLSGINLSPEDVVYPISMRLGTDICARVKCKSFWWQPGGITDSVQYEKYIEEYPFLKKDWQPLFDEFGVTHVIVNKKLLQSIDWSYDFSALAKVREGVSFIAYKVRPE